ncbi:MAG: hypothetical protein MUC96_10090 [Myxococcaceae bacterium]|jgi:hypothetical protein|nr:hypothetical protein [Myxococcaceae bacterium]
MPTQVTGTTVGYTNDYLSSATCSGLTGRDRVYSVNVPAGQRLLASIRQGASGFYDPSLNLVVGPDSQCAVSPLVCAATDDVGGASEINSVRYLNGTASAQTVFLVADTASGLDSGGAFRLDVIVDAPAAGDACENPLALVSGTPRTGEALSGFGNDYAVRSLASGSGCVSGTPPSAGIDRAYSSLVGAGETLTVTVTPSTGLDVSINLHGSATECSTRTCATSTNLAGPGSAETLVWTNTGTAARTMLVVVDTPAGATGTFTISATTGTLPGDVCSTTAPPITMPGTQTGLSLAGYAADYTQATSANGCLLSTGSDRVFQVTVPPRQRLVTTVTGSGGFDGVINVIPGVATACNAMPRVCSGSGDQQGLNGVDSAVWDNGTTSPQNAYVIVAGRSAFSSVGTFSLNTNFITGDSCRSPQVVAGPFPRTLSAQTLTGLRKDINPGGTCFPYSGPERVYEVEVPAGQLLTVTATPSSGEDLVLNLFNPESSCTAATATCVTGADSSVTGAETMAARNNGTTPTRAYVTVGRYTNAGATFNISFSITP